MSVAVKEKFGKILKSFKILWPWFKMRNLKQLEKFLISKKWMIKKIAIMDEKVNFLKLREAFKTFP